MNVLDIEARQWMREESMREIAPKALTLAERILEAAAELDATLKDIEDAQNYLNCWVTEFREGTEAQTIRGSQKRKERVSLPEDAFRPGAAIETMQAVVGVVTGCELIGGRLGGLREVEPDRFCSAVNRTEDWNGFIDGTGILHFQFQFIKNIHENLLRIASTTKIARAARDCKE